MVFQIIFTGRERRGLCITVNLTSTAPLQHSPALLFKTRMYIIYKMAQNSWHLGDLWINMAHNLTAA